MPVLIANRQKTHRIQTRTLQSRARKLLDALGSPDGELSIVIVSDDEMADLNRQYRKKRGPTNVLSFPMLEGPGAELAPSLLGDVVISADTAFAEAQAARKSLLYRMTELLIHGILHLLGHDHATEKEWQGFHRIQKRILSL